MRFAQITLATLAIGGLAAAQGTFEAVGSGCATIGKVVTGVNQNPAASNFSSATGPNEYGYPVNAAATATTVVSGVRWFTQSRGGYKTVDASLYLPDSTDPTKPAGTPLDTTKLTIGPSAQYWVASFNKPHVIKGKFWVAYKNFDTETATTQGSAVVSASNLKSGTNITPVYYRRPSNNQVWTKTVTVDNPSYDILTGGGAPAVLSAAAGPSIGSPFKLDLDQAGNGVVVAVMGFDNVNFGPVPLPLDLNPIAPSCFVFQTLDLLVPTAAAQGKASVTFPIPNLPGIKGVKFYTQFMLLRQGANPLGWQFSNSGVAMIG